MSSQFGMWARRPFAPLLLTHCAGAASEYFILTALLTAFLLQSAPSSSVAAPASHAALAIGLFYMPFLVSPALAGQLADRFDKARLIRSFKLFGTGIALLAALGFMTDSSVLLATSLVLLGVQSSCIGPISYATLAQQLDGAQLVGGNALMTSCNLIAPLVGALAAMTALHVNHALAPIAFVGLAVASYACSRRIEPTPPSDSTLRISLNLVAEAWRSLHCVRQDRSLYLSMLGRSWFWFFSAALLIQILAGAGGRDSTAYLAAASLIGLFAFGFAIGAAACAPLSDRQLEIGLVPVGSIGITLFALGLALAAGSGAPGQSSPDLGTAGVWSRPNAWQMAADVVLLGIFGGLYLIPLNALVQLRSDSCRRARTIGGNAILSATFVAAAALFSAGLSRAGLSQREILLVLAVLNAGVAIYIYRLVPEFLMRLIVWGLVHTVYRLRKSGLEHIPDEGAAVVVCNHVSFVDAVVISAACRRPIRFVMDHRIFAMPVLNFVFRVTRAIPIASPRDDIDLLRRAYAEISRALDAGELIGIFPEGRITDSGEVAPFQNGIRRIIDRNPVPVVPMALRGLWGSFFSRKDAPAMTRPLRRGLFNPIELVVAPAVPPDLVTPRLLQQTVCELRGEWK